MNCSSIKFLIIAYSLLIYSSIYAGKAIETLTFDDENMNVLLRQTAMPEMGESRLEKILARYYSEGLGGSENWNKIESLKVSGALKTKDVTYKLAAYQKKPKFVKILLKSNKGKLVLCSNGKNAWNIMPGARGKATKMEPSSARRFMHSAHFGNHMLYPYQKGKTVSYIDTVPLEGNICHQVRIVLDTDYQVDYYIDIRTYLEIKVVNTDLRDQSVHSVVYTDYIREFGMPIAKHVESYEDGEFVSELKLDEVIVNSGVMPWMFRMPK